MGGSAVPTREVPMLTAPVPVVLALIVDNGAPVWLNTWSVELQSFHDGLDVVSMLRDTADAIEGAA